MNDTFRFVKRGLVFARREPVYGMQDLGISPRGPMDRLAVITGNIMVGNRDFAETLEIILPSVLECLKNLVFVITGAHRECLLEVSGKKIPIIHGQVYPASIASKIHFGSSSQGLRTVLSYRTVSSGAEAEKYIGRMRGNFTELFTFTDETRAVRVVKGPEYDRLVNPRIFLSYPWKISPDSNEMGLRLEGSSTIKVDNYHMVSDVVADGTVQMTKSGPIILLYHRQTIGGYPRIFNVISSDLDLLAQYVPGQILRLKLVSLEEALYFSEVRTREIENFRRKYNQIVSK